MIAQNQEYIGINIITNYKKSKPINYKIIRIFFLLVFFHGTSQVKKNDLKTFLENSVSQKKYDIELFNEELKNNYYYSSLIEKAAVFKMFMQTQDSTVNLFSKNCSTNNVQFKFANDRIKDAYSQGNLNSNFLLNIKETEDKNFKTDFKKIFEEVKKYFSYLDYSNEGCNTYLNGLINREKGVFIPQEIGKKILSLNYILNPVEEILDNKTQIFSSLNNNPENDFFLTLKLPMSWDFKEKKDFSKPSTIGFFAPNEKFLQANISVHIYDFISKEEIKNNKLLDKDLVNLIYNDSELLRKFLNDILNKTNAVINCTLFNSGTNTFILYNADLDLNKIVDNSLLNGKTMKFLGALTFYNGKCVLITSGATNEPDFNTYNYYSKLFFKVITSVKFKDLKKNTIYLTEENNMKLVPININGINHKFLLDTGADTVVINKKLLSELLESNYITRDNFIKKTKSSLADGSIIITEDWLIPEMKVGNHILKNIIVSVVDSDDSTMLFGMNGLNKLNVFKLNLNENEIILNRE